MRNKKVLVILLLVIVIFIQVLVIVMMNGGFFVGVKSVQPYSKGYFNQELEKDFVINENIYEDLETRSPKSLFSGLDFSNIKTINSNINMDVIGEITNNNSVPISGYFKLVFYSSTGEIVNVRDSARVPGKSIEPGQTATFSVLLNKFEYSTISVEDSLIIEKK